MYYSLKILTNNPDQEIWIGDGEGNFVQKEYGEVVTRLLPGKYTVSFDLSNRRIPINLNKDRTYTKEELEEIYE